jgi:hypothetical protein
LRRAQVSPENCSQLAGALQCLLRLGQLRELALRLLPRDWVGGSSMREQVQPAIGALKQALPGSMGLRVSFEEQEH